MVIVERLLVSRGHKVSRKSASLQKGHKYSYARIREIGKVSVNYDRFDFYGVSPQKIINRTLSRRLVERHKKYLHNGPKPLIIRTVLHIRSNFLSYLRMLVIGIHWT